MGKADNKMTKKVGIITYHRAYNYGSALQSYALNKYIRGCGCIVETIDLQTKKQADIYKLYERVDSILSIVRNLLSFMRQRELKSKKKNLMNFY